MTGPAAPALGPRRFSTDGLAVAGALFGSVTTWFKITDGTHPWWDVTLSAASAYLFLLAGAVAARHRPDNRVGLLMVCTAWAGFAEDVQLSADPVVHTVGLLLRTGSTAVLVHLMLAFPTGLLQRRIDWFIVSVAYVWAFGLMPLTALFTPTSIANLLLVADRPRIADVVGQLGLPLAVAATASLLQRWYRSQWSMRQVLAPVLIVNLLIGLSAVGAGAFWNTDLGLYRPFVTGYQIAACVLPLAFLTGVYRIRLGRSTVARMVEGLNTPVGAESLRDLIATALDDPTLIVAFQRTDGAGLVGADGSPVAVPSDDDPWRTTTDVLHNGHPVAVLIHNRALLEDAHVLQAVSAAAGLALENERLRADLRAQLAEVRESRARIVAAGQAERARIERDLHDGVQAKLVAALISVRQAAAGAAAPPASAAERSPLERATAGLEEALSDLRRIGHGIRPSVFAEAGLVAGVRALLNAMPGEYALDVGPLPPLAPSLEETMYFVVAEAAANAAKHAGAQHLVVHLHADPGRVAVRVSDDGCGGAQPAEGSGLQRLADRVQAAEGRLHVSSPLGGGTVITAVFPVTP